MAAKKPWEEKWDYIAPEVSAPDVQQAPSQVGDGGGAFNQFVGGANKGAANVLGLPVDVLSAVINYVSDLAGKPEWKINDALGGSSSILSAMESPQDIRGIPRKSDIAPVTTTERFANKIGEYTGGGFVPGLGLASRTQNIGKNIAGEALATTTAAAAEQGLVEATDGAAPAWARTLAGMAGGLTPMATISSLKNIFSRTPSLQKIIDDGNLKASDMKNTAKEIYKSIEDNPNIVGRSSAADEIIKELMPDFTSKGWIRTKTNLNTGAKTSNIDEQYPIAKGVWERIGSRFEQPNLSGAEIMADITLIKDSMRQASKAAATGQAKGTEAEIVRRMLVKYEEKFAKELGTDYQTANSLYRSASNAETVADELGLAAINMDKINADEYKTLQNKLNALVIREAKKGSASSFSKNELQAIRDASKTTNAEDLMMWIGGMRKVIGRSTFGLAGVGSATGYISLPTSAGIAATAIGVGNRAQASARNMQRRDIGGMMDKILNNPNMSNDAKNKALRALSVYFGTAGEGAINEAMDSIPTIMP